MPRPKTKYRGGELLDQLEGGLLLLRDAVKAGDPRDEILFRIEEELRQINLIRQSP